MYKNMQMWLMISIRNLLHRIEYGTPVGREMEKLLKIPISNYNNVLTVLALPNFAPLLAMGWSESLVMFLLFDNHVKPLTHYVVPQT